jgi:hypothetical protein
VFKNNVRNSFDDSDHVATVHLKIKEIKQGRESVDDYVIWFEEFEGFTSFDDTALTKIFKEGLTPQILSCCYSLEVIPATLTTWKEKARLFHWHHLKLQQQQCHQAGQPQQQQQQSGLHCCYGQRNEGNKRGKKREGCCAQCNIGTRRRKRRKEEGEPNRPTPVR